MSIIFYLFPFILGFCFGSPQNDDSSGEPTDPNTKDPFSDLWLPNHADFTRFSQGELEELYCSEIIRFFPQLFCSQEAHFGRGGGGITFIVKDEAGKEYMLKVQETDNPRGIQALIDVQGHENIVEVWKAQVIGKHMVEVTAFADSGNLKGYQQRNPDLFKKPNFVYTLLAMIWNGVNFIHSKGIVHADLKLANIVVDKSGVPKIIDLDLCVRNDEQKGGRGTFAFMPPEVFAVWTSGRMYYDPKVDVFALGVILYHFIFEATPFMGSKRREVQESLEKKTFGVLRGTSIQAVRIFDRGLRWEASERADMVELRDLIVDAINQPQQGKTLAYDQTISTVHENFFIEELEWPEVFELEQKAFAWMLFFLIGIAVVTRLGWNVDVLEGFLERLGLKRKGIAFFK